MILLRSCFKSTSLTWWVLSFGLAVDVSCQLLEVTLVKHGETKIKECVKEQLNPQIGWILIKWVCAIFSGWSSEVCWIDVRHVFRQQVKVHGSKRYIMISFLHHHAACLQGSGTIFRRMCNITPVQSTLWDFSIYKIGWLSVGTNICNKKIVSTHGWGKVLWRWGSRKPWNLASWHHRTPSANGFGTQHLSEFWVEWNTPSLVVNDKRSMKC